MGETDPGAFKLGHTEKRCSELLESIRSFLNADRVDVKEFGKASWQIGVVRILQLWKRTQCGYENDFIEGLNKSENHFQKS